MTTTPDLEGQFRARSFAILIGVDRYQFEGGALPTLKCAVSDVKAIANALVEVGGFPRENIVLLANEEVVRVGISRAFGQLRRQVEKLRRERSAAKTRFLFYFSGHGLIGTSQGNDRTYLATYDTDPNNPGFTGLSWDDLDELIANNISPDQQLRLIDCCHAAGLAPGARGGPKLTIEYVVDAVARTEGQGVLFSCQRNELAWERREGNLSIFASALLEGLNGAAPETHGVLYLSSLVDYLTYQVPSESMKERGVRQTPVAKLEQIGGPMPIGFRGATIRATQEMVSAGLAQIASFRQTGALSLEEASYCENLCSRWILPKDDAEMDRIRALLGFFQGPVNVQALKVAIQSWLATPNIAASPRGAGARGPAEGPITSDPERAFLERMAAAQSMPQLPPHGYPNAPQLPPHQSHPQLPIPQGFPQVEQQTPARYAPYSHPTTPNPSRSTSPHPMVVLAAAIFGVGIFGGLIYAGIWKKQHDLEKTKANATTTTPASTPGVLEQIQARAEAKMKPCPDDMVLIEGGAFIMGADTSFDDEKPAHGVHVASFCMHTFEVTTAQYRACVKSGNCTAPSQRNGKHKIVDELACNFGSDKNETHPINCIKQTQATAYCASQGARLPREEEWEYAAKGGPENRLYVWGQSPPTAKLTNGRGPETRDLLLKHVTTAEDRKIYTPIVFSDQDGAVFTAPVGAFIADVSRFSVHDMGGNVSEWTSTPYCKYGVTVCTSNEKVVRGGSWLDGFPKDFLTTKRWHSQDNVFANYLGFRCARDIPKAQPAPTPK